MNYLENIKEGDTVYTWSNERNDGFTCATTVLTVTSDHRYFATRNRNFSVDTHEVFWAPVAFVPPPPPKRKIKRSGWVNLWRRGGGYVEVGNVIHPSEDVAKCNILTKNDYITTAPITWEEEE